MRKYCPENEKKKRDYAFFLEAANGKQSVTIDAALRAIERFELFTNRKPFRKFHVEQARSPFYFTTKAGEVVVNLYTRKHVAEVENFFRNFTQPIAAILVERNLKSSARTLVNDVYNGIRPELSILQYYVDDDTKWPIN